jgi:hypothetical protein
MQEGLRAKEGGKSLPTVKDALRDTPAALRREERKE